MNEPSLLLSVRVSGRRSGQNRVRIDTVSLSRVSLMSNYLTGMVDRQDMAQRAPKDQRTLDEKTLVSHRGDMYTCNCAIGSLVA